MELMYEGKAKQVFSTGDDNFVIIHFKDYVTAFNGEKKGAITGKGGANNSITSLIY